MPIKIKELTVGDIIVIPAQGIGTIIALEEEERYGCKDTFITWQPHEDCTSITIFPATQLANKQVRWPVNPGKMLDVLEVLRDKPEKYNGNSGRRNEHYRNQLNSPDLCELAACLRDTWLPTGTEHTHQHMNWYDRALSRLAQEVAVVYQTSYPTVRKQLESIIAKNLDPEDLYGNKKVVSEQ